MVGDCKKFLIKEVLYRLAEEKKKSKIVIEKEYKFDLDIKENSICKITKSGNITEVQIMDYLPQGVPIKKLNQNQYVLCDTGEVKDFKKSESRKDNTDSLYKTFKKIRNLVNTNFKGGKSELHLILTYAENMTDTKRLYKDSKSLLKKLYRRYPDLEYLQVVEPQGRGAWHIHMLCKRTQTDNFYIKNKELREMWGQGFVTVKRLDDVDNVGAYLSAYLGDIFLEDIDPEEEKDKYAEYESQAVDKVIDKKKKTTKKVVKGGRLHMYPPGMNIYRKSSGIIEPDISKCRYKDLYKQNIESKGGNPCFSEKITVKQIDEETETEKVLNTITYLQFNKNR